MKPDVVVFVALLTAYSHVGFLEQGWNYFRSMKPVHGFPHCSLRLHGKEHANGAQHCHLGDSPGCLPNQQNVEIASQSAKRISKLSTQSTGIHVLLSNIYGEMG